MEDEWKQVFFGLVIITLKLEGTDVLHQVYEMLKKFFEDNEGQLLLLNTIIYISL